MNRIHWRSRMTGLLILLAVGAPVPALAVVNPAADIVYVRTDCDNLSNCFGTLQSALDWTWGTRNPSATSPLVVDIGPGQWFDQLQCGNGGNHVTFRGAGRDATIIKGHQGFPSGSEQSLLSAAFLNDCTDLEFIDLGFESKDFTVYWSGPGESTWTDVDIINPGGGIGSVGWYEDICVEGSGQGKHYFFGSHIEVTGRQLAFGFVPATPYWSKCSETWFYGGEIHWIMNETNGNPGAGVFLNGHSDFHAFGAVIRVTVPDTALAVTDLIGVNVTDAPGAGLDPNLDRPAKFHMHGGIISVNAGANAYATAVGVKVDGASATAHTPGTAYSLISPFGSKRTEASNGGRIDAPFLWGAGDLPPGSTTETGGVVSIDGQDLFVETDCGSNGDCSAGGTDPHIMIYNEACNTSGTPWFDVVTGACRSLLP